jgi:hypothetical protein
MIAGFGKTTQKEFDEAVTSLPDLIKRARAGTTEAGTEANDLLWALANESVNTKGFSIEKGTIFNFGTKEE